MSTCFFSPQADAEDGRLFEWRDGPLVLAMKQEGVFLMDEISLADDSVLERLNRWVKILFIFFKNPHKYINRFTILHCILPFCSVLETEKSLVLAEKGSSDDDDVELIIAGKKFRLVATMNPGGDFGKKEVCSGGEKNCDFFFFPPPHGFNNCIICLKCHFFMYVQLSPALRNRFTEIWCPQSNSRGDLMKIVQHNLRAGLSLDQHDHQGGCATQATSPCSTPRRCIVLR